MLQEEDRKGAVLNLFPAKTANSSIVPRPYQVEAHEALDLHLQRKTTNPCVVIPTGGGKSYQIAWAIQQWKAEYPPLRVIILAHRKELVDQNYQEMLTLWPAGDIGVYSAGLNRKDEEHAIIFAGIDSIYNKWGAFPAWDVIIIDEAHRIPAKGEGKYREFIKGCRVQNKDLRVVGFTATPFRMGCGPICHKDHILNEVCYEANVGDLIAQEFLCRLRSKVGEEKPDLSNVKRNSGGDYISNSLAAVCDTDDVVTRAVRSAMGHIGREARRACIWFCVDVEHCTHVGNELRKYSIDAPTVTAETPSATRKRFADGFKDGAYNHLLNVNVFTEGFNAKRVDCVVLLRPTLSKALYAQMVGRGLRLHPDKTDCLVLDYAGCIEEHGPIDCLDAGKVKIQVCAECKDAFSRAIRKCPHCGWEIPPQEVERIEAEDEREKRMHEAEHSNKNILGSEPDTIAVDEVSVQRHRKPESPDSIRVTYRCGIGQFNEWICLDHQGFARTKSRSWWQDRFGREEAETVTVDTALDDMFLGSRIKELTKAITVIKRGKFAEIVGYVR